MRVLKPNITGDGLGTQLQVAPKPSSDMVSISQSFYRLDTGVCFGAEQNCLLQASEVILMTS